MPFTAMPRSCQAKCARAHPRAFGEDLRRYSEVELFQANSRSLQVAWRKGAAHVARPGEATKAHQMIMDQRIRHQFQLL